MSLCAAPPSPSFSSAYLVTVTGTHVEGPTLDTIHRELDQLTHAPVGSSVTLQCGSRSLRVKYRPDTGFDVLTYRQDHAVDDMFTTPARVMLRSEAVGETPRVDCGVLLGCIASFLAQADQAA